MERQPKEPNARRPTPRQRKQRKEKLGDDDKPQQEAEGQAKARGKIQKKIGRFEKVLEK